MKLLSEADKLSEKQEVDENTLLKVLTSGEGKTEMTRKPKGGRMCVLKLFDNVLNVSFRWRTRTGRRIIIR